MLRVLFRGQHPERSAFHDPLVILTGMNAVYRQLESPPPFNPTVAQRVIAAPLAKPRIISDNGPQFIARDFKNDSRPDAANGVQAQAKGSAAVSLGSLAWRNRRPAGVRENAGSQSAAVRCTAAQNRRPDQLR